MADTDTSDQSSLQDVLAQAFGSGQNLPPAVMNYAQDATAPAEPDLPQGVAASEPSEAPVLSGPSTGPVSGAPGQQANLPYANTPIPGPGINPNPDMFSRAYETQHPTKSLVMRMFGMGDMFKEKQQADRQAQLDQREAVKAFDEHAKAQQDLANEKIKAANDAIAQRQEGWVPGQTLTTEDMADKMIQQDIQQSPGKYQQNPATAAAAAIPSITNTSVGGGGLPQAPGVMETSTGVSVPTAPSVMQMGPPPSVAPVSSESMPAVAAKAASTTFTGSAAFKEEAAKDEAQAKVFDNIDAQAKAAGDPAGNPKAVTAAALYRAAAKAGKPVDPQTDKMISGIFAVPPKEAQPTIPANLYNPNDGKPEGQHEGVVPLLRDPTTGLARPGLYGVTTKQFVPSPGNSEQDQKQQDLDQREKQGTLDRGAARQAVVDSQNQSHGKEAVQKANEKLTTGLGPIDVMRRMLNGANEGNEYEASFIGASSAQAFSLLNNIKRIAPADVQAAKDPGSVVEWIQNTFKKGSEGDPLIAKLKGQALKMADDLEDSAVVDRNRDVTNANSLWGTNEPLTPLPTRTRTYSSPGKPTLTSTRTNGVWSKPQ